MSSKTGHTTRNSQNTHRSQQINTPPARPRDGFGTYLGDYLFELNAWENDSPCKPQFGPPTGHRKLTRAIAKLQRVDFSSAQALLVASVPGMHKGRGIRKYGAWLLFRGLLYCTSRALSYARMNGGSRSQSTQTNPMHV